MMPIDQRTRQLCREKKVKVYGLALWRTVLNKKGGGRVAEPVASSKGWTGCALHDHHAVLGWASRCRWGSEKSVG